MTLSSMFVQRTLKMFPCRQCVLTAVRCCYADAQEPVPEISSRTPARLISGYNMAGLRI